MTAAVSTASAAGNVTLDKILVSILLFAGQTFQQRMETFLPRYSLDSHKVVFPAVNTNECTYRTAMLTNNGPTPIVYDFDKDPTE